MRLALALKFQIPLEYARNNIFELGGLQASKYCSICANFSVVYEYRFYFQTKKLVFLSTHRSTYILYCCIELHHTTCGQFSKKLPK